MAGTQKLTFGSGAVGPGTYQANQSWQGGKLALIATSGSWGGGNAQFQMLTPDGTWVNIGSSVTANAAPQIVELPPCQLQVVVTTATGVTASAVSVPTIVTK